MRLRARSEHGFTVVESLVASAIIVTVTAGIFSVLNPSRGLFKTQPEVADMQQRLRIGVDALMRDLMQAGAGSYSGIARGSLANYFAPIMPFRRGLDTAIDDGVATYRNNAITIVYVPSTATQTTLRDDMAAASAPLVINTDSGCPYDVRTALVDPVCGFKTNITRAAIYDSTGAFDVFGAGLVDEGSQTIGVQQVRLGALSKAYLGSASNHLSKIVDVSYHVYYMSAPTKQLMHYDGFSTVTPVLDNVAGLDFEYYGEPAPPMFKRPGTDRSVTYGPAPPEPGVAEAPFAPGENCTWQVSAGAQITRLAALGSAESGLVRMTASQLTDGPWCPDDSNANRYDADLLRIRKVRVTLRLQPGSESVRASSAASRASTVPDQAIRFDVSPRNMNLGR